jgi:transcriptional regulator GlxA family with amidase domain
MVRHRRQVNRRIEKAAYLLSQSMLSVAQIALMCGFCDQSTRRVSTL